MKTLTLSLIDNGAKERGEVLQKAVLLLAAAALNALELAIPRLPFFPWLKPGLANIITILWIVKFGFRDAMLFTALRVWIGGFYFGFSLFTFSLGITGGLLATAAMSALWAMFGKRKIIGAVGLAIVGALFHNAGQLALVYFMMSGNVGVLAQIPFMLSASIVFGTIVGILTPIAEKTVCNTETVGADSISAHMKSGNNDQHGKINFFDKIIVFMTFAISITLMFVADLSALIIAASVFSMTAIILSPQKSFMKILAALYPLKFYILFVFVAFTHLLFSYGTKIENLPFITYESLNAFVVQSLRLWCWLQTIHIFKKFNFHAIFMSALRKFFPSQKTTLEAGMIALKHFPEITRGAKGEKFSIIKLLRSPRITLQKHIAAIRTRIAAAE